MIRQSTKMRETVAASRERNTVTLFELGWTQKGDVWVDPNGGVIKNHSLSDAIDLERLRGRISGSGRKKWKI